MLIFLRSPQRDGNCAALFPSEGISFYDESAGNSLPAVPLGAYKAERLLGSELRFRQRRNAPAGEPALLEMAGTCTVWLETLRLLGMLMRF